MTVFFLLLLEKKSCFYRYEVKAPFTTPDILDPESWQVFKRVWPVHLTKNALALVGFMRVGDLLRLLQNFKPDGLYKYLRFVAIACLL